MSSLYQRLEHVEKTSVEKLSGIVHGWLTMQIVILAVFILVSSIGSNPLSGSSSSGSDPPYALLVFAPVISIIFMKIVQNMNSSNIQEIGIKKILKFAIPSLVVGFVLIESNLFSSFHANPYILGASLVVASIWPALKFQKMYTLNLHAEAATPQILRDITEARKAGMGPEKCVIHACKRKDFKSFNTVANAIANKLEWGIPLPNIFETLQKEIKNFQVLISFRILFEIITSGGGNVNTLDSLADTSEKIHDIAKNKRDMLSPYVMVGFMLIVITGFTTLLTIDSFSEINKGKNLAPVEGQFVRDAQPPEQSNSLLEVVSLAVIAQAWLAGLFIGKITKGAYSGGFLFSIFLTILTMFSIGIIQMHLINIGAILKPS
jgi:flagellar protein FlaJ